MKVVGGAEGIRTPYLLNAIQSLSQLSYSPTMLTDRRRDSNPYLPDDIGTLSQLSYSPNPPPNLSNIHSDGKVGPAPNQLHSIDSRSSAWYLAFYVDFVE